MIFKQICLSDKFVWFWIFIVSEMVTLIHGAAVASYGNDFFLPYFDLCNNDAYIQIVPTFVDSKHVLVNISLINNRIIYSKYMNQSGALNINLFILMEETSNNDYTGWIIKTSHVVSCYLKRSKGDMTILFPTSALSREYVLPSIANIYNNKYKLILYATLDNTTIRIYGGQFVKKVENVSQNFENTSNSANNDTESVGNETLHTTNHTHINALNALESLGLVTYNLTTTIISADRAIGVMLLVFNQKDSGIVCDDLNSRTMESIPPISSFGKEFYFPNFEQQSNSSLAITGLEKGSVFVKTDQYQFEIAVIINDTVHCDFHTAKYVMLIATVPIQVYVTTVVVISETQEYITNDFFIPPQEQYFRCSLTSSCTESCPVFLKVNNTRSVSSYHYSFTDANSSVTFNVSSELATENSNNKFIIQKMWTSYSFMYVMLEIEIGSIFPIGTQLNKLYAACVINIATASDISDGLDNDCDGKIDEESVNRIDDDGDSRIDEDTTNSCTLVPNTTPPHSKPVVQDRKREPRLEDIPIDGIDSTMPLIAVVLSLTVAIFAVFALISIFMLLELLSRRKQLRNTKIRPFVS